MTIIEVTSAHHVALFLHLPKYLYRNVPQYVSPLDRDIEFTFNKDKNPEFLKGNAKRWLLVKDDVVIGRIAAFYQTDRDNGGIGFYDCIDNDEAARLLFQTAEKWLSGVGYQAVLAPVNFGERDKFWGLLVDGFDKRPVYLENYNFPYYQKQFQDNGYREEFSQITSETTPDRIDSEGYKMIYDQLVKEGYEFVHYRSQDSSKFIRAVVEVYNLAWREREFFRPISIEKAKKMLQSIKWVIRDDLMWFVYKDGQPVSFYLSIIDLNQVLAHLNGNLKGLNLLKFFFYLKTAKIKRTKGIVFGITPEHRSKGIYKAMMYLMWKVFVQDPDLKTTELSWVGTFNDKMQSVFSNANAVQSKLHVTYKKDF